MAAVCWSAAYAQEALPSRSLTIEGAYNPTVSKSEKIMPVPEKPVSDRKASAVTYLTDTNPLTGMKRNPMGAFAQNSDDVITPDYYGLVRFGYGLRNIHDGVLDFGWKISEKDQLLVSGLMDAWSTKTVDDWKSRMLNGDLTALYSHRFDAFTLNVDGALGYSHFNYMEGLNMTPAQKDLSSLLQKTGRERLGVSATGGNDTVDWHAGVAMEWLSRNGLDIAGTKRDNREFLIRLEGGITLPLMGGTGGLEYRQKMASYHWQGLYGFDYSCFTTVTVTPFWKYTWRGIDANLGVNVDFRSGPGYVLLFSPMATASYRLNDSFKLIAGVTGGLEDNNMRRLSEISPYWSEAARIKDGYTLFDASAGASYSQGTWLSLSAKGGYRHTLDELFQTLDNNMIVTSYLKQETMDVFYVRLDADMLFADRAQVKMDVTCNGYTGKYTPGVLALKPVIDASLFGKVNIIPGLDAMLTYRAMSFSKIAGTRMPMVNDVALTVDYDFRPNLSLYVTGNRLAGGDWFYYAGYRSLKPSVMVGATYRF